MEIVEMKRPGLKGEALKRQRKRAREEQRKRDKEIDGMIKSGCTCEYGSAAGPSVSWDPYCPLHRRDGFER